MTLERTKWFINRTVLVATSSIKRHLSSGTEEWKELPFPKKLTQTWEYQSSFFLTVVGYWGRTLIRWGNDLKIHNQKTFLDYLNNRPAGQPLLTVCNHTSMVDDPSLIASIVEGKNLRQSKEMRWVLGAKEIMFTNSVFTYICSRGKVIPTVRGDGVYQPAVDYTIERMNDGDWIHIFPEAKCTLEPIRLKWGVGRILAESKPDPIVLPFWHCGMQHVLPCKKPYIPRLGKKVTILFGEPINVKNTIEKCRNSDNTEEELRIQITNVIQEKLYALKPTAEKLHLQRFS